MQQVPSLIRPPRRPFDTPDEVFRYTRDLLRIHEGRRRKAYIPPVGRSSATISTGLDLGQHDEASLRAMGIPDRIVARLKPLAGKCAEEARQILNRRPLILTEAEDQTVEEAIVRHYMHKTAQAYDAALHTASIDGCTEAHGTKGMSDGALMGTETEKTRLPQGPPSTAMEPAPKRDEQEQEDETEEAPAETKPANTATVPPLRKGIEQQGRLFNDLPKELQAPVVSVIFQHGSPRAVPRFWRLVTGGDWHGAITEMRSFYRLPSPLQARRNAEAIIMEMGLKRLLQLPSSHQHRPKPAPA